MIAQRFTFLFHVTCERNSAPYVARIQWNGTSQTITREMFKPTITPLGRNKEIAQCYFTGAVGDVIETCRGGSKKRQYRALYLLAPTGYLILLAMADEANELVRIMEYLDGKLTASELSRGRWLFETVTSEWRGAPEQSTAATTSRPCLDQLKSQAAELQARLSKVTALIQDEVPHSTPSTPHTKRTVR